MVTNSGLSETEHLLEDMHSTGMEPIAPVRSEDSNWGRAETSYTDNPNDAAPPELDPVRTADSRAPIIEAPQASYRVYKTRWFGLGQLVLLNIVVSWDVSRRHEWLHTFRNEGFLATD